MTFHSNQLETTPAHTLHLCIDFLFIKKVNVLVTKTFCHEKGLCDRNVFKSIVRERGKVCVRISEVRSFGGDLIPLHHKK